MRTIEVPVDVLEACVQIMEIASDWNAPTFYEVDPPEGWEDEVCDADADEPTWIALYLFRKKLASLIQPLQAAKS